MHFRLKVPSGEYGSIFVAFKRFFVMPAFHFMQLKSYFSFRYFQCPLWNLHVMSRPCAAIEVIIATQTPYAP